MIRTARAESTRSNLSPLALNDPFFRLLPDERLILAALHLRHWTYERIGKIVNQPTSQIESTAWRMRIHLASLHRKDQPSVPYPAAGAQGAKCPEFNPMAPWTQRFLDRQCISTQKVFLESHLAICQSCQGTLQRSRRVFYAAEQFIPRMDGNTRVPVGSGVTKNMGLETAEKAYEKILRHAEAIHNPSPFGFLNSLKIFFRKKDVQIAAGVFVLFLLWNFFRK